MKLLTIKMGTEQVEVDPELYREFCLLFYNSDNKNGFLNKDYFYKYLNRLPKPYFLILDPRLDNNSKFTSWLKDRDIINVIEKVLS